MPYLKKVVFALPFLLFFFLFSLNLDLFLTNFNFLFSFDLKEIFQLILLVFYLLLSSSFFVIFVTLSMDFKIVLPIIALASLIPLFLITSSVYLLIFGFFLAFLIIFFILQKKLKNYLAFQPTTLLIPSIKKLSTLIILISSLVFYLNISQSLEKFGFSIPDSLLDPVIKMTTSNLSSNIPQGPGPMLDISGILPNNLIKEAVSSQINNLIGPNIGIVAIILSVLFFVSLNFLASFLSLLLYPIISVIFWILDKMGFTKYEITQREVKKLVV